MTDSPPPADALLSDEQAAEKIADCLPSNWLDPIFDDKLKKLPMKETELLCARLRKRIKAAALTALADRAALLREREELRAALLDAAHGMDGCASILERIDATHAESARLCAAKYRRLAAQHKAPAKEAE